MISSAQTSKGENKRRHILKTATGLFAQRSYSAVGMREIARESGVNLAMINYYFGSKAGLLKEIMADFFEQFRDITKQSFNIDNSEIDFEGAVRNYVRSLTQLCRQHNDQMKVTVTELPGYMPEIAEFKKQQIQSISEELLKSGLLQTRVSAQNSRLNPLIGGTALGGMIIMHFLLKPIIEPMLESKSESDFYEYFPDYISHIFLFGTTGGRSETSSHRDA